MSRRVSALLAILVTIFWVNACGKATTSPSGGGTTASLRGTLTVGTTAAHVAHARPAANFTGVTVTVVGSGQQAIVDASNQFTLTVPAGQVQLQFTGTGVTGTVTLTDISAGDAVTATFFVTSGIVTLGSDTISNGGNVEMQGVIDSILTGSSFSMGGQTIVTTSATQIVRGSTTLTFADLGPGQRVTVTGTQNGNQIQATRISIEEVGGTQPITVSGTVTSLTGTASGFTFDLSSTVVEGNSGTIFTNGSFASLKNGSLVTVQGQQGAGFVQATSIQIQ